MGLSYSKLLCLKSNLVTSMTRSIGMILAWPFRAAGIKMAIGVRRVSDARNLLFCDWFGPLRDSELNLTAATPGLEGPG